jgi:hypothetical protein
VWVCSRRRHQRRRHWQRCRRGCWWVWATDILVQPKEIIVRDIAVTIAHHVCKVCFQKILQCCLDVEDICDIVCITAHTIVGNVYRCKLRADVCVDIDINIGDHTSCRLPTIEVKIPTHDVSIHMHVTPMWHHC